jgi:uncharacterized repeat protein (TIGR01451 family)
MRIIIVGTLLVSLGMLLRVAPTIHVADPARGSTSAQAIGVVNPAPMGTIDMDEEAELWIDAAASGATVISGSAITYTLTVTNYGLGPAGGFSVADELPDETTLVSCAATSGGICGGSGNSPTIAFADLAPDASATITIVATVNCPVPNATEITNFVMLYPLSPDPLNPEEEDLEDPIEEEVQVTVLNPVPVVLHATATPATLWPPKHQWVDATTAYTIQDNCGPIAITQEVSSNEPVDGTGDGDTAPDWQVMDDHHVRLRAERAGTSSGRVYTITITATDSVNQSGHGTTAVRVAHDRNR